MKVQIDENSPGQQSSKLIEVTPQSTKKVDEIHEDVINENDGFDEFQDAAETQKEGEGVVNQNENNVEK